MQPYYGGSNKKDLRGVRSRTGKNAEKQFNVIINEKKAVEWEKSNAGHKLLFGLGQPSLRKPCKKEKRASERGGGNID